MDGSMAAAITRVCQDLGLPAGDAFGQDWAYELPEEFRTREFFEKYLLTYSAPGYGPLEKRVLMQLILDVANDLLEQNTGLEAESWNQVAALLQVDGELHQDLIEHWALIGEPLEDAFPLTPRMRAVREALG
ncbi:MAG TPA: hypothetical protein VF815_40630 [Myxococcaceae bacterium]|jgi:hypothetical protein